jgi:hypothetical protein
MSAAARRTSSGLRSIYADTTASPASRPIYSVFRCISTVTSVSAAANLTFSDLGVHFCWHQHLRSHQAPSHA